MRGTVELPRRYEVALAVLGFAAASVRLVRAVRR